MKSMNMHARKKYNPEAPHLLMHPIYLQSS